MMKSKNKARYELARVTILEGPLLQVLTTLGIPRDALPEEVVESIMTDEIVWGAVTRNQDLSLSVEAKKIEDFPEDTMKELMFLDGCARGKIKSIVLEDMCLRLLDQQDPTQ